MKFVLELGEDYPNNFYMSLDGRIPYSQIGSADSNHQYAIRAEKVEESSFAELKVFNFLISSTQMELLAETHTRYFDHYSELDLIEFYRVLIHTIYSGVSWGLIWNFSIDNWDVKESPLCTSSFENSFRVGGITSEVKNARSFELTCFLFRDFKESRSQFFCGVFEIFLIAEGAQTEGSLKFLLIIQRCVGIK